MRTRVRPTLITSIVFASTDAWPDAGERIECVEAIQGAIASAFSHTGAQIRTETVCTEEDAEALLLDLGRGLGVFTAMNGGVQQWMLRAATHFTAIALCAGFVGGFMTMRKGRMLLERNAAPATMDVFSALQHGGTRVWFMRNSREIVPLWQAVQAVERIRVSTAESYRDGDTVGDSDAAATLRLVGELAHDAQWMSVAATGGGPEPDEQTANRATLCRISVAASAMTLFVGTAGSPAREHAADQQFHIVLDAIDAYTRQSFGHDQVVCNGDIREPLVYAAVLLGLELVR